MPPQRTKSSFYAVKVGRNIGVYMSWPECEAQVKGYPGPKFKKFETREAAEAFAYNLPLSASSPSTSRFRAAYLDSAASSVTLNSSPLSTRTSVHVQSDRQSSLPTSSPLHLQIESSLRHSSPVDSSQSPKSVPTGIQWDVVYAYGTCSKATGIASIGIWWGPHHPRNIAERCPGRQTRKSAELQSIARLLESVEITEKPLLIRTESEYFINCFKIWIKTWKQNNWLDSSGKQVKNAEILRYISQCFEIRSNYGQKVVVAYTRHREGKPGTEGARELASRVASSTFVQPEPEWREKTESSCQVNRRMIALGRVIAETEILGPNDVSENIAIESHAIARRSTLPATISGGPTSRYIV